MAFWSRVFGNPGVVRANANPPSSVGGNDWNPGDPDGLELQGFEEPSESRSLPWVAPSPWSGWPSQWTPPNWTSQSSFRISNLVDIAWACIDLNANVLSSMPVYRMRNGAIIDPVSWMTNPDPMIYTSWQEFAKQLFWDLQMGEAFVMPMVIGADGYPASFRVIPPFLVTVEMRGSMREYILGGEDVTHRILHIRYISNSINPRGLGPLDAAGLRMTTIGLLQRYANNLAETGGVPQYWIGIRDGLSASEADDTLERWIETRTKYVGHPALLTNDATLNQAHSMNAKDMTLLELSSFNESRISVLLGVPPFLMGLTASGGTHSTTYSNISDLFDYHFRSSLRPKSQIAMKALSGWALPGPQSAELNRDDYTQLPLDKRYAAYAVGIQAGFLTTSDVRTMERLQAAQDNQLSPLQSAQDNQAAQALTGSAD